MLFFDKKPASEAPWTSTLWVYDVRTNKHYTLKQNQLRRTDLDDSLEDLDNLPAPEIIAREIVDGLTAALAECEAVAAALENCASPAAE